MDLSSSPSYSSSLNTPLVPRYYVDEDSNSSMETYPPSPRFGGDYAVLELDDTHEFVTPAVVGEPQAVPAKGAESGFPQDEEDDWSNDGSLLSQVIDMQNRVEQRQQEEDVLLQQQQQQPPFLALLDIHNNFFVDAGTHFSEEDGSMNCIPKSTCGNNTP